SRRVSAQPGLGPSSPLPRKTEGTLNAPLALGHQRIREQRLTQGVSWSVPESEAERLIVRGGAVDLVEELVAAAEASARQTGGGDSLDEARHRRVPRRLEPAGRRQRVLEPLLGGVEVLGRRSAERARRGHDRPHDDDRPPARETLDPGTAAEGPARQEPLLRLVLER